ncbi:MAG TPA: hypothetical protein VNV37_12350, partial [Solirubrobacteraceae bacterium]|nr:hypothetical protein [Solirubrobacteraceae bacterium]
MAELSALDAVTEAVESGAGLPEVVRAAARALDASLAVTDAQGGTLAVAARSPAEERALLAGGEGVSSIPLRVADAVVGSLHVRARAEPSASMLRLLVTMIASEVERVRAPGRASENAAADFLRAILARELSSSEEIVARGRALSLELQGGASMIVARAHPQAPTEEGWRARVRAVAERGARAVASRSIAALTERDGATAGTAGAAAESVVAEGRGRAPGPDGWVGVGGALAGAEVLLLVPGGEEALAARAADSVLRELQAGLPGCTFAVGRSRIAETPAELPRAANEALLAANVAEGAAPTGAGASPAGGVGEGALAFEQTGAYRLLLSTMSENP